NGLCISRYFNSLPVVLVSSANTTSASLSTSMALRVMSFRFPIGVGTKYKSVRACSASSELIDSLGQGFIFLCNDISLVVRTKLNENFIIDITPIWMVVLCFRQKCHSGHKGKGFREIPELESLFQLIIFFYPPTLYFYSEI